MSRMTTTRRLALGAVTLAISSTLVFGMANEAPLILYPITPSLPPGLYVRTFEPPAVGMIAAFRVPKAAKRYKASIGEDVHEDFLFMKPIVAGPGDHVCLRHFGAIFVNGIRLASVDTHDQAGRLLPHWRDCRQMRDDELFALSTEVPNSFDSRYFGPLNLSGLLGTYQCIVGPKVRKCSGFLDWFSKSVHTQESQESRV